MSLSFNFTASEKRMVVASWAPVRHSSPKGTRPPKITLPRALGREYFISTSPKPICCLNSASGLAGGMLSCAWANPTKLTNKTTTVIRFILIIILFKRDCWNSESYTKGG